MPGEEMRTAIAVVALVLSIWSVIFTWRSWRETHRPMVTVFVAEHGMGNVASTFNLVLSNTGNRPAVEVRLHADPQELRKLIDPEAPPERFEWMSHIFDEESMVPILRNGEDLRTSFGAYAHKQKWLNYGEQISVRVSYRDLDGRRYKSQLPLRVYAREGFGGGSWSVVSRSGSK